VIFLKDRYAYKSLLKRLAAFCFDAVGSVLFSFPRFTARLKKSSPVKRILVIRLDPIGDVVMTWPAVAALKKRFPEAEIDFLASRALVDLIKIQAEIHEVIPVTNSWFSPGVSFKDAFSEFFQLAAQLRKRHYDLAIDFRGDLRNILLMSTAGIPEGLAYGRTGGSFLLSRSQPYPLDEHQVRLNFKLIEHLGVPIEGENESCRFKYSEGQKENFWSRFPDLFKSDAVKVVVHPTAGYPSKQWPLLKYWQLIQRLAYENLVQVILIGSEKDQYSAGVFESLPGQVVDLRGKTQLADLPILFDQCDFYIGNDSGPAHLAAIQGLPVLVIASGTNDIRLWHPWTKQLVVVNHQVPCSPCEAKECPLKHHDCMEKITVEEVLNQFKALQSQTGRLAGKS